MGLHRPLDLSPKKYNELTLREIEEGEDELTDKLQLCHKVKAVK